MSAITNTRFSNTILTYLHNMLFTYPTNTTVPTTSTVNWSHSINFFLQNLLSYTLQQLGKFSYCSSSTRGWGNRGQDISHLSSEVLAKCGSLQLANLKNNNVNIKWLLNIRVFFSNKKLLFHFSIHLINLYTCSYI